MSGYMIWFDQEIPLETLREVLHRRFGLDPSTVMSDRLPFPPEAGRPAVLLECPDWVGGFAWCVVGGPPLEEASGLSELELARVLVAELHQRALVDDGTPLPDRWILVALDGSYGPVIIDDDRAGEGDLRILHAEAPISGEPDLPVIPPVIWP